MQTPEGLSWEQRACMLIALKFASHDYMWYNVEGEGSKVLLPTAHRDPKLAQSKSDYLQSLIIAEGYGR